MLRAKAMICAPILQAAVQNSYWVSCGGEELEVRIQER